MEDIPKYNVHSNEKYMSEARNNNSLLDILLDFVVVSIPLTLAMEFIFYRIFYCLFDY